MMLRSSTIELNPNQAQAWHMALSQSWVKIEGWTALEQLHFVEQLALSALVNGEKCLLLDTPGQAVAFRTRLEEHQVTDFCALHQNSATLIKQHLLQKINSQNSTKEKLPKKTKTSDFEFNLDKLERCRLRLNKVYEAVRKPVFGNLSWPALLGLYWSTQEPGKGLLNISKAQNTYAFTYEEYKQLLILMEQAQSLYQLVQTLDHPLQHLHPQIFLKKDEKTALRFSQEKLRAYQARFDTLAHKYNQHIEAYGRLLRQYFEQHTQEFLLETDQLLDQIRDNLSKFGAPFLNAKLGKIKWYGSLSAQGKSAIGAYKLLIQNYESLKRKFERLGWFTFAWPALEKARSIAPIKQALESFENTLKNGHLELVQFIQEEQLRLNSKSVLPALVSKVQVTELEEEMDELLTELNEAKLLNLRVENKMLTLNKRKQYLSQVQQQLTFLLQNMPDFAAFYNWHRFWLQRSALEQNLLSALSENSPKSWALAFQNWYMEQVLLQSKSIDAPLNVLPLKEYHQFWSQFKIQLPEQINYIWSQRRLALQKKIKGIKANIGKESELLTQSELEAYTELFPVICLGTNDESEKTPDVTEPVFNWVVVWENSESTQDNLKNYASLGERVIVFSSTQKPKVKNLSAQVEETSGTEPEMAMNSLWSKFQEGIHPYFGMDRLKQTVPVENDLVLPLTLQKKQATEQEVAFLSDGLLSQIDATDYAWEWQQQEQLRQKGWALIPIWSAACWQNLHSECRKIAAQIISLEKQKNK